MRAREFVKENAGVTTAASMAPVSHSLGTPLTRVSTGPAKYANSLKKRKTHAGR